MLYDWWYLVTIVMTTVCVSLHEASISGRYCRTPLEDAGQCVSLKFCPEVVNLFRYLHANIAKQYSSQLHRICGNRVTFDNYPIVRNYFIFRLIYPFNKYYFAFEGLLCSRFCRSHSFR